MILGGGDVGDEDDLPRPGVLPDHQLVPDDKPCDGEFERTAIDTGQLTPC